MDNLSLYLLVGLLLFIILVIRNVIKAYVIYYLGDPTPKYRKLLSFNPIDHIDPLGTLLLFITPIMTGGRFVFGWVKYIDYDSNYFKNRDIGELVVGAFGLLSFLMLIAVCKILYFYSFKFNPFLPNLFYFLAYMSAFLFALNLLPIKGFDGYILLSVILRKINKKLFYTLEDFYLRNQFLIIFLFFPIIFIFSPILVFLANVALKMGGW
ncbi:MAG: site-2 protease family protein [bacterium]|jgi:Zn-dependent protease